MKPFYVFACLIVAVISSAKATIKQGYLFDWYDCSNKADGNYLHPNDCTRFIACSGGVANQMDCAPCHIDARRCPLGRLVYNSTKNTCLWADETTCETDSSIEDTSNSNPQPGDDCEPEECVNFGYCLSYLRCNKEIGKWIREECGENLVWNPLNPNGTPQIHGGNCDIWDNLSEEVEREYRKDPDCHG